MYLPERKNLRLPQYDYASPGTYFVTVVSYERQFLFGDVVDQKMIVNENGWVVETCWLDLPNHYPNIRLGTFIVMPNHLHGIIEITSDHGRGLSEIVRGLKSYSSMKINQLRETPGIPVWQRSYHEHIVRNEEELEQIQRYIEDNPKYWEEDENYIGPTRIAVGTGHRPVRKMMALKKEGRPSDESNGRKGQGSGGPGTQGSRIKEPRS